MTDSEKSNLVRVLQVLVPVVGVGIAVVTLLIALADRKKELVCAYLGADRLVSLDAGGISAAVKVEYEGQTVTSLTKMRFVARNTGSSAIKGEDVREPITLYFPKSVQLLNTSVDRTSPTGFYFHVVSNPSENSVTFNFPLLNSGDEAYFSVFAYNSSPIAPQVSGRIVDVREIQYFDESQHQQANPFPFASSIGVRRVLYWVVLSFNALCVVLIVGVALYAIVTFARLKLWWQRWRKAYDESWAVAEKSPMGMSSPVSLDYLARQELKKQGIPTQPDSIYDDWKDLLGGSLVLSVLAALFFFAVIFMLHSPRGY
jgi:hypothetical protein